MSSGMQRYKEDNDNPLFSEETARRQRKAGRDEQAELENRVDELHRRAGLGPASKDTNPKDAIGIKKATLSVFPLQVLMEASLGMLEGACKYGRHNYRDAGIRGSVYFDAVCRHIFDWWEGTDIDPDSNIHHISKAISCLAVLRDAIMRGNFNDDRPPRTKEGWIQELNQRAAEILAKYPNPLPAHTQRNSTIKANE